MTGIEVILGAQAAKNLTPPVSKALADLGKAGLQRLLVKYTNCFEKHEQSAYARAANIKNILYRDRSVLLREKYVHCFFCGNRKQPANKSDKEVVDSLRNSPRWIISGTAGAGKTMFMRYAVLELVDRKLEFQKVPIYIELRYLSEEDLAKPFLRAIFDRVSSSRGDRDYEKFVIGLDYGLFVFLFDAIDEVSPSIRDRVIAGIRDMMARFPACPFLTTTRPDQFVESIQDAQVVYTADMDKEQIKEVIYKLDYDDAVKVKLLSELDNGLFEKHQEFLSNPLLATIMLLTYDQAADIPTKITSFYDLAFQALYQRHDAAKDTYRRGHAAGLPMDEFEKFFSTFCFVTLAKSKYEFSDKELRGYVAEASGFLKLDKSVDALVKDSVEAVCLIQPEGLQFTFVHRSFQEYFAAVFASRYRGDNIHEVIDACVGGFGAGNFINLLDELDRDVLEYHWTRVKIRDWLKTVDGLNLRTASGMKRFMENTVRRFTLDDDGHLLGIGLEGPNALEWMIPADRTVGANVLLMSTLFDKSVNVRKSFKWKGSATRSGLEAFQERIGVNGPPKGRAGDRMTLRPSDAPFLIKTDLPIAFERMRAAYKAAAESIEARQAEKIAATDLLLSGGLA